MLKSWASSQSRSIFINLKNFRHKRDNLERLLPFFSLKNISLCFVHEDTAEYDLFLNDIIFQDMLTSQGISFSILSHQERDFDMMKIISMFDSFKNICRRMRNEEYHGRLYFLDDDELFDKLCDRQSNLKDLEWMWLEHEVRVIIETTTYYLSKNVKYRFPHMYDIISQSVSRNTGRLSSISTLIRGILEFRWVNDSIKRICNLSE